MRKPRQVDYSRKGSAHAHKPGDEKTTREIDGQDMEFDICSICQVVFVDVTTLLPVNL